MQLNFSLETMIRWQLINHIIAKFGIVVERKLLDFSLDKQNRDAGIAPALFLHRILDSHRTISSDTVFGILFQYAYDSRTFILIFAFFMWNQTEIFHQPPINIKKTK